MFQGLIDSRDVEQAAKQAARTGKREDLYEYLKLRKRFQRQIDYSDYCYLEAKLIDQHAPDPEGAREARAFQRKINEHNAQNAEGHCD